METLKAVLGPLLGYEGRGSYTVCILLCSGDTRQAPTLVFDKSKAPIPFVAVAQVGSNTFWRAATPTRWGATKRGGQVTYTINAGGAVVADRHGREAWTFHLPTPGEEPRIAYASCNGFSSVRLVRDTDQPYLLWQRMKEQHDAAPFALLLMGGDQVYADELWESPNCPLLRRWSNLDSASQLSAPVTQGLRDELVQFYNQLYPERWKDPTMSLMLASIPSIMMWDDHDIFDGWGSHPPERQACPVFQAIFAEAARAFDIFQMRCGTATRLSTSGRHRAIGVQFGDYSILVLDHRSERTLHQVMSEHQWSEVKGWLRTQAKENAGGMLLVLSAVPVVYRSFATVEQLLGTLPGSQELEDDVVDHWSAQPHQSEQMRLIMVLFGFLEAARKCSAAAGAVPRIVLLSGDVHVGALGQITSQRAAATITQVISSGIVHPPPSAFQWAGIRAMTSDAPRSLGDGDVRTELLTPFGGPQYLRTRNFATVHRGTDRKLWVNWVCEEHTLQPSFAVA